MELDGLINKILTNKGSRNLEIRVIRWEIILKPLLPSKGSHLHQLFKKHKTGWDKYIRSIFPME